MVEHDETMTRPTRRLLMKPTMTDLCYGLRASSPYNGISYYPKHWLEIKSTPIFIDFMFCPIPYSRSHINIANHCCGHLGIQDGCHFRHL